MAIGMAEGRISTSTKEAGSVCSERLGGLRKSKYEERK